MIPSRENINGVSQLLPSGWEQAFDPSSNRFFYVDHNTKTTTWLNPIDRLTHPNRINEFHNDQLPYGWERVNDPTFGVYYIDHINRRNQRTSPVLENHYSNSPQILGLRRSGNSLDSNNHTISPATTVTTTGKQESSSIHASDIEKSATSLNNSTNLSAEIINSTTRSTSSPRDSKQNLSLLDMMDSCFGRESSQSVEV